MQWYLYPLLIAAGFIAGFINTLAGSGSAVTLPALIFAGLPANVANGTNRVAILLQTMVAATSFRRSKVLDLRGAVMLSVPAVLGSLLGAQIAVNLNEELMRRVIGILMLVMLVVVLLQPKRWLHGKLEQLTGWPHWKHLLLFFAIGVYGGFIQAGVGIFMLVGLVLGLGYDLVRANAVKVTIALCFTVAALVVFVRNGQVDWGTGLVLAIGNMLGAQVAARVAVQRGAVLVHRLLIVIMVFSAAKLLGVFDLLARLI